MRRAVITGGLRTPFVKAGKEFSAIHPADLAAQNMKAFFAREELEPSLIDEALFGNVANLTDAANLSRVAWLRAGLPQSAPAATIHKNCASSLESIAIAAAKIQAGFADIILAGGAESMSQAPIIFSQKLTRFTLRLLRARSLKEKLKALASFRPSFIAPRFGLKETLTDPLTGLSMGETSEIITKEFGILREDQDRFTLSSHQKAFTARQRLSEEIFSLFPPPDFEPVREDRGVRKSLTLKKLSAARPFFDRQFGTVTVFNSCPMNDGSALVILMAEGRAKALGMKPLARVRAVASAGLQPQRMGLGPVYAAARALDIARLKLKDMDLIEINEAFAGQVLACLEAFSSASFAKKSLNRRAALGSIDMDRLNVNGGALAIGHPVSATGARLALTLSKELQRRQAQFGLIALCVGGGQGAALILEAI